MKDLIQEGRNIQETFKRNVIRPNSLNEGFFYNLFSKITDKLEKLGDKTDSLSSSGDKIIYAVSALALATTPFSFPIALGIMWAAIIGTSGVMIAGSSGEIAKSMMKFFEKRLSDRQYNKNVRPILQKVFTEIFKNPEVTELKTLLTKLSREKSSTTGSGSEIESKITDIGEKLDDIFNTALNKVLGLPEIKPYLDNIRADKDSFKGSQRGMGKLSPPESMSDSEIRTHIKSLIKDIITLDQSEYYKIQTDSEKITESIKRR